MRKLFERLKAKARELKYDLSALYLAYKRKDVSVFVKIVIIVAIVYALSPIDLIPDFIPVLGYLDDLLILPLLVYLSVKMIPKPIVDECRVQAKDLWKDGKPKKWYFAIPIVVVWLLVVFIILKITVFKD